MSPRIDILWVLLLASVFCGQSALSVVLSAPTQSGLEQVISVLHRVQDSNAQATRKLGENHDALQEACQVVRSRSQQLTRLGKLLQTRLISDEKEQQSLFISSKTAALSLRARLSLLERGDAEEAPNSRLSSQALRHELETEGPMASYRRERHEEAIQRVQDQTASTAALAGLAEAYASTCRSALKASNELLHRGAKQEGGLSEVLKSVQGLAPPSPDTLATDPSVSSDGDLQVSDFELMDDQEVADSFLQLSDSHSHEDDPHLDVESVSSSDSEDSDLLSLFSSGGGGGGSMSTGSSSFSSSSDDDGAAVEMESSEKENKQQQQQQQGIQQLASSLDASSSSSSSSAALMQKVQQLLEAAEAENVSSFAASSEWCSEERAASKVSLRAAAAAAHLEGARAKDLEEAVQQIGEDLERINATEKFVHDASLRLTSLLEAQQKLFSSVAHNEGLADRILKEALRILAQSPHQPGRESALIAMQNAVDAFSQRPSATATATAGGAGAGAAAASLSEAQAQASGALDSERTNLQARREQHLLDIDRSYDQKRLFDVDLKSKVDFMQSLESNCAHRTMPQATKERKVEIRALSDAEDVLSGRALRASPATGALRGSSASPAAVSLSSSSSSSSSASSAPSSSSPSLELDPLDDDDDDNNNDNEDSQPSSTNLESMKPKTALAHAASARSVAVDSSDSDSDSLEKAAASLGIEDES